VQLDLPQNKKTLEYLGDGSSQPLAIPPSDSPVDPYRELGSHPDAVEWVWERLGENFDEAARQIVLGQPALVAPESGEIIALAFGTAYIIKLPADLYQEAQAAGYQTQRQWSIGSRTDLARELGAGWLFGCWEQGEADWLVSAYSSSGAAD
jgi:hypothetical protein